VIGRPKQDDTGHVQQGGEVRHAAVAAHHHGRTHEHGGQFGHVEAGQKVRPFAGRPKGCTRVVVGWTCRPDHRHALEAEGLCQGQVAGQGPALNRGAGTRVQQHDRGTPISRGAAPCRLRPLHSIARRAQAERHGPDAELSQGREVVRSHRGAPGRQRRRGENSARARVLEPARDLRPVRAPDDGDVEVVGQRARRRGVTRGQRGKAGIRCVERAIGQPTPEHGRQRRHLAARDDVVGWTSRPQRGQGRQQQHRVAQGALAPDEDGGHDHGIRAGKPSAISHLLAADG
jgi:hypothetical protein